MLVTSVDSEEDAAARHPDELSSEPRELFLHRKIEANKPDSGISGLRAYSYHHSERQAPHQLCKLREKRQVINH